MKCSRCGRHADFLRIPEQWSQHLVILGDLTHDQAEMLAYYCPDCKKCFCGHCCLPKWQELKRKEGLSGRQLAAKLEADPNAYFGESPTCPQCKRMVSSDPPKDMPASASSSAGSAVGGSMRLGCLAVIVLTVLVGAGNFAYQRWDKSDRKLDGHKGMAQLVTFAPDGKRILSSEFQQAILWDAETGKETRRFPCDNTRDGLLAISSDGRCGMIVAHLGHRMLKAWDLETGKPAVSPGPPVMLSASAEYPMYRDAESTGGGRKLGSNSETVLLNHKPLGAHPGKVRCVTITPDGRWGCSACDRGVVIVWDLDQAKELRRWDAPHPKALLFTPHGKRLAGICHDGVQVWNVDTGRELRMCVHWDEVRCAAFSVDGRMLATASGEAVRLWKLPEH